jgi:hypothetical protein
MQAIMWAMGHFDVSLRGRQFSVHRSQTTGNPKQMQGQNNRQREAFPKNNFVIKYKNSN